MNIKLKILTSLLLVLMLGTTLFGLSACTASKPDTSLEDKSARAELRVLGNSKDDSAIMVEVTNSTGKDIVSFAAKSTQDAEFPDSLVTESTRIKAGETVVAYINRANTVKPNNEGAETLGDGVPNGLILRTLYTIALTFSDGSQTELHDLCLEELQSLTICLSEDSVAYVEFTDFDSKTGSTLETEKALKLARDEAAAESAAAAESLAQAEAAQNYGDYSYNPGSGSGGGSQSSDACVDPNDLIFR
ncbi:MAG: hypothetical protein LBP91_01835 [Coriobacteriales bacterium]|jgi:hypothetical protein|nr:hypothetical protein [Coriobacteriales bacterium]